MASKSSIARTKQLAYESLKRTTTALSGKLNIEVPELDVHKRYPIEYRYAKEMERVAAFMAQLLDNLDSLEDDRYQEVVALVSTPKWTKTQLETLVLGEADGA